MIIPIEDYAEFEKLHKYFVKKLDNAADDVRNVRITYQPKQIEARVAVNNQLQLWWHNEKRQDHYWGPFGSNIPSENGLAQITVNITYKHTTSHLSEGGAFFAINDSQEILLVHTGNIKGGVKGVGPSGFWNHYRGASELALLPSGKVKKVAIIANVKSNLLMNELARFVHHVAEIKEILKGNKNGLDGFSFNPEFHGKYTYNLPETVTVQSNHGLIVNELTLRLKSKGLLVGNDQKMDIFIYRSNDKISHLIEVKTKLSTQNLYGAIGQLYFYSLNLPSRCKKIFVAPKDIKKEVVDSLDKLNIDVVRFSLNDEKIRFYDLDKVLKT